MGQGHKINGLVFKCNDNIVANALSKPVPIIGFV